MKKIKYLHFAFPLFFFAFGTQAMLKAQNGNFNVEYNSNGSDPTVMLVETQDDDFTRLFFTNSANALDKWSIACNLGTTDDHEIGFYYNGTPRLVYDETNGGLGIGTADPEGLLHVNGGDTYLTGSLPRLFLINDGDADTRIGFGNNGAGAGDAALFYDSTEDMLNIGTNTTSGDLHIASDGKIGVNINASADLNSQLTIRANAGTVPTPAQLDLNENNNSGYAVLRYSNFSENGKFTAEANTQYGNFIGGDADYRIRFSEDGTTYSNILTAVYAYDDHNGVALNTKDERIGIRTTSPTSELHVLHKSGVSGHGIKIENEGPNNHWWKMYVADGNGTLSFRNDASPGSNVGTFATDGVYTGSDIRMKEDIKDLDYGLEEVMNLETKSYRYKANAESNKRSLGLIAQDVKDMVPEMVLYDEESDQYSINYDMTAILAIKAIQEQQVIIEELKAEIERLKTKD